MQPENIERSERVIGPLEQYALEVNGAADIDTSVVSDFLTDLRHYCNFNGLNFDQLLLTSEINFENEV